MTDLQRVLTAIAEDLGDPVSWGAPVEFRDSLALCALNSAYSLRATSAAGANVLTRYRAARPTADTDSGPDLVSAMDEADGPEGFARDVLRNDSKLPGTTRLRTEGLYEALTRLASLDTPVTTSAHLRATVVHGNDTAEKAWLSVKGFGPLSWSYLLMNAGVRTETKPDVMVHRYLARALGTGHTVTPTGARQLLERAAAALAVEPRALDRAIWLHESPSAP